MKTISRIDLIRRADSRFLFGILAIMALLELKSPAADYSGRITDGGTGVGGLRVHWSYPDIFGKNHPGDAPASSSSGNWASTGWPLATSIRFSISQSGYSFSPSFYDVNTGPLGTASRSDLNFTRSSAISGVVKLANGVPVGGVIISRSGSSTTATTSSSGAYSFAGLSHGTYTITPSKAGYVFSPSSLSVTVGPGQPNQNFMVVTPVAATLSASAIGFGNATFNGSVVGEGTLASAVWFEYGLGGNFNLKTPPQVLAPNANLESVIATAGSIMAGPSYNVRLVAANTNGTNFGQSVEFIMPYPAADTAITFDGVNDFVQVGADPLLKATDAITIEAWVNPTVSAPVGMIVNKEGEYELWREADGTARYAFANTSPGWVGVNTGVKIPESQWTHVALTYDSKAATDRVHFYTNGILAYTGQASGLIGHATGVPANNNELHIGSRSPGTYWKGSIDEVRIWSLARSGTEVQDSFDRHLAGTEAGLVVYFQFNEESGTTLTDKGPNGINATLQNGAAFTYSGALITDPVVSTLAATPVLATRATLQALVNPAQSGTVAYFEYGETIGYGSQTVGVDIGSRLANVPVSTIITNLQPGTTYHFRAVAFNNTGTTFGEDQSFMTLVLGVGWPASTKVTGGFSSSPRHVVDAQGNTYMAGLFSGSATFKTTMVSSNGTPDAFVGKLGRGADWIWNNRVTVDAAGSISVNAIALDSAKNVYVAGQFSGTATFGTNILSGTNGDVFVAKLNSDGSKWVWARSAGSSGADSANGLAVSAGGSVYIAGFFTNSANFGSDNLVSLGGQDIFAAKLDANGNWLWSRNAGGSGSKDSALGLALNSAEEVYMTGSFEGVNASFGGTIRLDAAGGAGDADLFVARLNKDGLWLVARRAGSSTGDDLGTGLAIDAAGQIYLLGKFAGTADYDSTTGNLNQGTTANLFVAKLNSNASMLWHAQAGEGYADSITVDSANRVYVTGEFTISTKFGNPTSITLTSRGNSDVFLARLDSASGDWAWAKSIGSSGSETRGSIGVDGQGGVVVSGTYQNTVQVGYVLLSTANERDIFVARFDSEAVVEHNNYVIGQPIPVPIEAQDPDRNDEGAIGQPAITILEKDRPDSDALNSFVWTLAEHKLYPVRPVTAILKWPLTRDATNTTSVATAVGRSIWPQSPQIHVANTPVELEPAIPGYPYRFASVAFTTIAGANVEASTKQFTAAQPGWTVLQFFDTGGELPNPSLHSSKFEVVKTIFWNDPSYFLDNQPATIGTALTRAAHNDPTGKNGFVFFENSFYDGEGDEKAYDRSSRTGPIIPVNKDTRATNDDLVVIWYATNSVTGIAWPSMPIRYIAQWPTPPPPDAGVTDTNKLVLASGLGSGELSAAEYPNKRVYNQPDPSLPGYNPNEEHAALYGDTLYALRNDLNTLVGVSEPYTLLKYRDPVSGQWKMRVFKVVATDSNSQFTYSGEAGELLQLPAPLGLLPPSCGDKNTWISGPGFKDHLGRIYARAAGPNNSGATLVARFWYPLQPGFFYDLDRDGQPDLPVGQCVPWLDRRAGGEIGVPVDVTYNITWPANVPTLEIGESLLRAKFELPDVFHFAKGEVVYDEGDPTGTNGTASITRLFDPLSVRTVQLRAPGANDFMSGPGYSVFRVSDADALFEGISTANKQGSLEFSDLPWFLRARLRYDPINKNLSFAGILDESEDYGGQSDPLLLLNVLSPRERDKIKGLSSNESFGALIDALYDLTRNPNQVDLDGDEQPDTDLLVGLTTDQTGNVVAEALGDGPKMLSAGFARKSGYVTIIENDDPSLGGLPVTLHVIRVGDGPVRGDIKVLQSDNTFDEKLTLRHSADFGGEPQKFDFEWFYKPVGAGVDPSTFPAADTNGTITDLKGWIQYTASPPGSTGVNDITLGDGGTASLLVLSDNYFICRYRGYVIDGKTNWSDWVGIIGGGEAQLAEGWVKRVRNGLNPFETRNKDFHENETATFASMIQQAGRPYEGDIAVNPAEVNNIGLIEAYQTVLHRAKRLSIEASPPIDYQPANDALLLAGGYVADLYLLLGNEAFADAADPTIGFRTDSSGYGTLAPSIFTFQNQLDSLLEEELCLLRGRDDRSATVRRSPVYNRLFWNFTHDEGEVAYAQAYNITDQNKDGLIDATDARIMYPQGHGDAWGYYLSATTTYYSLLRNPDFLWVPRTEPILLAGVPQKVDYLDERKFARAAAAKAKTGAQIVDLTYRFNYVDDPAGQFQGYKDTDTERAWGVSGWAHRAGSGAFFDWVTANAILPATDPETNHVGIEKIDRTTVPELSEILSGFASVQAQIDKADQGLNPLGLAKNVVPFDIDPSAIDAGKTHFEQIYDRAIDAMNNAVGVFNHANQLSQALRSVQDTVNNFSRNVDQQERDYKNRLIEIFGYPYASDIGPGKTYPSGYDGPDLYHYMYVNAVELNGESVLQSQITTNLSGYFKPLKVKISGQGTDIADFFFDKDVPVNSVNVLTQGLMRVSYPLSSATAYGLVAPPEWGQRRAPGELQQALSDLLQSQGRLKQALANYDALLQQITDAEDLLNAHYQLQADIIKIHNRADLTVNELSGRMAALKITAGILKAAVETVTSTTEITLEAIPKVVGTATDVTAPVRGTLKAAETMGTKVAQVVIKGSEVATELLKSAQDETRRKESLNIEYAQYDYEIQEQLKALEQLIRQEPGLRLEALTLREALFQNIGRYQSTLAKGSRLLDERIAFRKNAAADTQATRYQDMTFRIFRNDAIQKYRAQFDLTAQYVFLAATAYDYETELLGGHTGSGREFLTDIIRQRSLGEVNNGVPIAGRHGLADPLARLSQNFSVLKGQLGFNNPETEKGRFSLRSELFRLRGESDDAWRAELKKNIVPDLWQIPEFRRYCRPFAPESAGPQPGLVIRFPTTVTFGLNYFGWPLGGRDNAYDPTLFATKVRSAGVWFEGYPGDVVSQTPRVYLVPVGADVMRSPSGNNLETREWRVVDQKIPVPFPIGFSSLNDSSWIPQNDSLSDTFADIRRFSSFRAYPESDTFDSEMVSNSRLIGRSVWNTDWMLIIPGGTFLANPEQGLDTFIDSVGDIKILFQTYSYSGN